MRSRNSGEMLASIKAVVRDGTSLDSNDIGGFLSRRASIMTVREHANANSGTNRPHLERIRM
jgi:hypothetical protein